MIDVLNSCLASALDLSLQFFDEIADRLRHFVDVMAERATALGGIAEGTARLVSKHSHVAEYDLSAVTGQEHVRALAEQMSLCSRDLNEAAVTASRLGDLATEDILIEQLRALDMDTWFLDASRPPQPKAKKEVAEEIPSPPPWRH